MATLGVLRRTGDAAKDVEAVKAMFQHWGSTSFTSVANDASPLYAFLITKAAQDNEIAAIAAESVNSPMPLVFLASVQYILSREANSSHPLRNYYATFRDPPLPTTYETYEIFRKFVIANKEALLPHLRTVLVQTNEVRRCALILPALHVASQRLSPPFAFIEFGSSAGLNLLPDYYFYRYHFPNGKTVDIGNASSPIRLESEVRSNTLPLPTAVPSPVHRIGLDLRPLDVADNDSMLWLQSFIWPEHRERRKRLSAAIEVARKHPVQHMAGDAVVRLREAFTLIPPSESIIVWHSFVLNQFPQELRTALYALMKELSHTRPFVELGLEFESSERPPTLTVTHWCGDQVDTVRLAECGSHGTWIRALEGEKK